MNIHERIAKTLGWTVKDAQSFDLPSLREFVRSEGNQKLAEEISVILRRGEHIYAH